ncbi:MAG: hypothetical protein HY459_02720 [Parcubacteria group bacterium]|nr:hypothetical protein [Parcubacteria group bacterium]
MSKRSTYLLILVLAILLIVGIVRNYLFFHQERIVQRVTYEPTEQAVLSRSYEWTSKSDQVRYEQAEWNTIVSSRYDGLKPRLSFIETAQAGCDYRSEYLRREGGIRPVCFWLKVRRGLFKFVEIEIKTPEKLREISAPVEDELEAVSFVALTNEDLKSNDQGILAGHSLAIEEGFLVEVIRNNALGCGPHVPTGTLYKVTFSGAITEIAKEKVVLDEHSFDVCVD